MKQKVISSVLGLYSLELDMPFYVLWVNKEYVKEKQLVRVTEEGFQWYNVDLGEWVSDNQKDYLLVKVLLGDAEVEFYVFKPKNGEKYSYFEVGAGGNLIEHSRIWENSIKDFSYYCVGNCFPYSMSDDTRERVKKVVFNKLKRIYEDGISIQ